MIDWPEGLVLDLARRRCVVFAGSGVSAHAKNAVGASPKTWSGLTDALLVGVPGSTQINALKRQFDYLSLCEVAEQHHGSAEIGRRLRNEYVTPAFSEAEIHKHIFGLDARVVATPNFDKIYETFANGQAHGTIAVKHYYDADVAQTIRGTERVVLKIHGTIDAPAQCVLTRRSYAAVRTDYREFYDLLSALFLTNSVLFLGCGFSDPDIRLILEDAKFKYKHSAPHYFLVPKEECKGPFKSLYEASLNIKIITFSRKAHYEELVKSLEALVILVEAEREKLKVSGNW